MENDLIEAWKAILEEDDKKTKPLTIKKGTPYLIQTPPHILLEDLFGIPVGEAKKPARDLNKIYKTHINCLSRWRQTYLRFLCPPEFHYYGWIVAGGCLRNLIRRDEPLRDVDIYQIRLDTKNADTARWGFINNTSPSKLIVKNCGEFKVKTDQIWEVDWRGKNLQIISPKRSFSAEAIIRSFDFNAVCLAFDGEYLYWTKAAIKDLHKKEISMASCKNPYGSLKRLARYHKEYNYKIDKAFLQILNKVAPNFTPRVDDYFV